MGAQRRRAGGGRERREDRPPLDSAPSGPGTEWSITAQGHPRAIFQRAIGRGNLMVAEMTLRDLGHPTLVELLDLTALIACKDPRRHPRVATRWLLRYLETHDQATIEQGAFVAAALVALGGPAHDAAYIALRDMAERASRRAPRSDVPWSRAG